jgi:NADPH-dependent ferric siderophore reductase
LFVTDRAVTRIRHELRPRLLTVQGVTRPTPKLVRITLGGPELAGFAHASPQDHVKLSFPPPGGAQPIMPTLVDGGLRPPPPGSPQPILRDYTVRRHDPAAGELDVDIVLHGDGPAATWAAQASAGQVLGVLGPRGSQVVPATFDWYLLIGDETALPAIAGWLARLPATARAFVFVEVADAAEEQPLASPADVRVTWLHRDGAEPGTTDLLARAVAATELPDGDGFVWAAGEAGAMRPVRRHLRERGLPKEWVDVDGYWKRGVANHDHHAPIDDDEQV